jgi:hypothetical protein
VVRCSQAIWIQNQKYHRINQWQKKKPLSITINNKMPDPNKQETKEEYVKRFMQSEEAKKDYPDEKQRLAVANSKWKQKSKHKEMLPMFTAIKIKEEEQEDEQEEEENEEKTYTFIGASTLPDRTTEYLPDGSRIEGEILSKNVLDKFAEYINDGTKIGGKYGSYRTISLFHDRVHNKDLTREEAGYAKEKTAKVVPFEELGKDYEKYAGNYALVVDATVNEKYKPPQEYSDYTPDKIHYKIDKGAMGLSVEYNNRPEQEKIVSVDGEKYRYIIDSDDFRGFGFARSNLIGNPTAVRIKEITLAAAYAADKNKTGEVNMAEDAKLKEAEQKLAEANAKVKELQDKIAAAEKLGADAKTKELKEEMNKMEAKIKEMKLESDATAAKLKESIELAFSGLKFQAPAKTKEDEKAAKVKEVYQQADSRDWVKFKELADARIEENEAKVKETISSMPIGKFFEKYQTLSVKCKGSQMVVVPSAKTKDVITSGDMAESTYYQTNAMFADRYVAGITETFLKEDSLLTAMPKEQHISGNDKYQWRIWTQYETVTGNNTLAVNPDVTSVSTQQRDFEKMETRICEYRDAVEVSDFTQAHSMAAIGDLLGKQIERAASAVVESMNADLFKPKTDDTTGWLGFVGLIGVADSSTYTSMYGKTRSATNRLLDSTTANTYLSTSEGISVEVLRDGYEKVLAHGSRIGDIVIVAHPTQVRRLFNSEDAAIRNNILTMSGAPASFGFSRTVIPHIDGIPIIRDYRCESSAAAADTFAVVDLSTDKGFNLIVSKPLGVQSLAKVGLSEKSVVNFWGCTVYKSPRNVFVHTGLTAT